MKRFSETILPVPYKGKETSPYPCLIQVEPFLWMHCIRFSYWDAEGKEWMVEAGSLTDLASIPRALWAIIPPHAGPYIGPATIHDDLYRRQITTKEEADDLFAEMMDMADVPHITKQIIVEGVRVGGWDAWDKHTAEINARKGQT